MEKIIIDKDQLKKSTSEIDCCLSVIEVQKNNMTDIVSALMHNWHGDAASVFFREYSLDEVKLVSLIEEISGLIDWMEHACDVYTAVGEKIKNTVNEIKLVEVSDDE